MPFSINLRNLEDVYKYLIEKGQELDLIDVHGLVKPTNVGGKPAQSGEEARKRYSAALFDFDFNLTPLISEVEQQIRQIGNKEEFREDIQFLEDAKAELVSTLADIKKSIDPEELAMQYQALLDHFEHIKNFSQKLRAKQVVKTETPEDQLLSIYEEAVAHREKIRASCKDAQAEQQPEEVKTVDQPSLPQLLIDAVKQGLTGEAQKHLRLLFDFFKENPLCHRFVIDLTKKCGVPSQEATKLEVARLTRDQQRAIAREQEERQIAEKRERTQARVKARAQVQLKLPDVAQEAEEVVVDTAAELIAAQKRAMKIRWAIFITLGIVTAVASVFTAGLAAVGAAGIAAAFHAGFAAVVGGASVGGGAAVTTAAGALLPLVLKLFHRLGSALKNCFCRQSEKEEPTADASADASPTQDTVPASSNAQIALRKMRGQIAKRPPPPKPAVPAPMIMVPMSGGCCLLAPWSGGSANDEQDLVQKTGSSHQRQRKC